MSISVVLKSGEAKLMEALNALSDPFGWHAIHFHLSDLLEQYQSEYQIKIAVNLIHDLLKTHDGGIFLLSDNSIMVLSHGMEKPLLSKLVFQLRYLYLDDPLAYSDDGQENPAFCTTYDLSRSWQELVEFCSRRMAMTARRAPAPVSHGPRLSSEQEIPARNDNAAEDSSRRSTGLSALRLANIERDLQHADIARVIRRQPVCAVTAAMQIRPVFSELYIHIAHLRQMLKVDADFLSNRWLFKYLTHALDERMMELIRRHPADFSDSPVSLNLNVETLLSSKFAEFNASIKPALRVSMVIEVPVVDVFADMAAFMLAKNEVQKMGYRVCLDGLTTESFININREKLGLDLIKVQWNADAKSDITTDENQKLLEAVRITGSNRVILCRCDNRQAVEYGHALGISLFQGRYLDNLINPNAKVAN